MLWEEGAGVTIRTHPQQQQVKHRKIVIWEGLCLKFAKNNSVNIFHKLHYKRKCPCYFTTKTNLIKVTDVEPLLIYVYSPQHNRLLAERSR